MTTAISQTLAAITTPGTFAARARAATDDLEIEVKGVGRLSFPITVRAAGKLRAVARPSAFGLGEQTLYDTSVRNTWEIPANRLRIDTQRWKPALTKHLSELAEALGLPKGSELRAEPDKLLLYEQGEFFEKHQDSEKQDAMIGTLVVLLPSEYAGGALEIEQRGEKRVFQRLRSQAADLSLIAFYADCQHRVTPVTRGVRVALTYRLLLRGGPDTDDTLDPSVVAKLTREVQTHFDEKIERAYQRSEPVAPERLVYLLDHEYTERGLSWSRLKNGDRVRVAALKAAAQRLDCECFLALADVHETWSCEDGGDYRRGRRGWNDEELDDGDDDDDDDDHELIDLCNVEIELRHWLDAAEKRVAGSRAIVEDAELCVTKPSVELVPWRSEHEGYQGNYGNTVDRWYHRAALVMWPRRLTFALSAQGAPEKALDRMLALRGPAAALEAHVRTLLPRWSQTLGNVKPAAGAAKVTKIARRLDDPKLAQSWLAPLGLQRLRVAQVRSDLVELTQRHGLKWSQPLFEAWLQRGAHRLDDASWAATLPPLCQALLQKDDPGCAALARWLVDLEIESAVGLCRALSSDEPAWLDLDGSSLGVERIAAALVAAITIDAQAAIERLNEALLDERKPLPLSLVIRVLLRAQARSKAVADTLAASPLRRACVRQLEAMAKAKPRPPGKWSIDHTFRCGCADCTQMQRFLTSATAALDWPLAKPRRQHLHEQITRAKLPLRHTTLRQGSPQVLQLSKDGEALRAREAKHQERAAALLRKVASKARN